MMKLTGNAGESGAMQESRAAILEAVAKDLIGPQGGVEERISASPSDQYLTGRLMPKPVDRSDLEEELQASDDESSDAEDQEGSPGVGIPMGMMGRPNVMGISFAVKGDEPTLLLTGTAGRYHPLWRSEDGHWSGERTDHSMTSAHWQRTPMSFSTTLRLNEGAPDLQQFTATEGLRWWVRKLRVEGGWQVSIMLENCLEQEPGLFGAAQATFFQVGFRASVQKPQVFMPRLMASAHKQDDHDTRVNALIYRNAREWAVGHTCSASWEEVPDEQVPSWLETTWLPEQRVFSMDPNGDGVFASFLERDPHALDAGVLGDREQEEKLCERLALIPDAYESWLESQRGQIEDLASEHRQQAQQNVEQAAAAARRMKNGILVLQNNAIARQAFQLGQQALALQASWKGKDLRWRPFQLGFQLLSVAGIAAPVGLEGQPSEDRSLMDLLWFPTGGGKTEAYLGIAAFALFYRRLREQEAPHHGKGVTVIMRYTLRLLTIQQFERAAAMVLACELIRSELAQKADEPPFSIGLWVGNSATPKSVEDARTEQGQKLARQIIRCPQCGKKLKWDPDRSRDYRVICRNKKCELSSYHALPVFTIDELIYENMPSLLIGTVDKFAQIVRNFRTHRLFGSSECPPPELIIQDELHLISGPLGTITGIYEAAIDRICTNENGIPPKIIGSTATIRRAEQQVLQLFNRPVELFPPPVIDADNSCFAVADRCIPGRVYVGVTTAGRSAKFTLQAVAATLMQRASEDDVIPPDQRDPFWTLLLYFNSLRELGGALVMMHDDVTSSIQVYADQHEKNPRSLKEVPAELTSRIPSEQIPDLLEELQKDYPAQMYDAVLATNMISVGVDIPRLGLMLVNGQPKGMAEYIQATSRVGRNDVPGLIFTLYNASRPRDLSRFEAFRTWHQTLYREVEATSVTPFAPRARDKAMHAAIIAMARHLVPGVLRDPPELDVASRDAISGLIGDLVRRVDEIDPEERAEVQCEADAFLGWWSDFAPVPDKYWNDFRPEKSLLISWEKAASLRALGRQASRARPTPNSMRDVEPSVTYRLVEKLWIDRSQGT